LVAALSENRGAVHGQLVAALSENRGAVHGQLVAALSENRGAVHGQLVAQTFIETYKTLPLVARLKTVDKCIQGGARRRDTAVFAFPRPRKRKSGEGQANLQKSAVNASLTPFTPVLSECATTFRSAALLASDGFPL
jgi:hypothetical protein